MKWTARTHNIWNNLKVVSCDMITKYCTVKCQLEKLLLHLITIALFLPYTPLIYPLISKLSAKEVNL